MDSARLQRYADKLAHAENRLGLFASWREDAGKDLRTRLASYKALQEAAEAFADVAAMIVVDSKRAVKDDATNLRILSEAGVVAPGLTVALVEINGLRNVLVHEYDGIDDARALASAARLAPSMERAIKEVRIWLSTRP
ncbi:MAG: HepT-like ribonuclease domain-containing protein [Thermoplasmatota archaeon]